MLEDGDLDGRDDVNVQCGGRVQGLLAGGADDAAADVLFLLLGECGVAGRMGVGVLGAEGVGAPDPLPDGAAGGAEGVEHDLRGGGQAVCEADGDASRVGCGVLHLQLPAGAAAVQRDCADWNGMVVPETVPAGQGEEGVDGGDPAAGVRQYGIHCVR